jgi:hypothetical protein
VRRPVPCPGRHAANQPVQKHGECSHLAVGLMAHRYIHIREAKKFGGDLGPAHHHEELRAASQPRKDAEHRLTVHGQMDDVSRVSADGGPPIGHTDYLEPAPPASGDRGDPAAQGVVGRMEPEPMGSERACGEREVRREPGISTGPMPDPEDFDRRRRPATTRSRH